MVEDKRGLLAKTFTLFDKYPEYVVLFAFLIITLGFPTIGIIWGKTEKVQLLSIDLYQNIFLENYGMCAISVFFLFISIIIFIKIRKNYKKEIHRVSEEKRKLQELLLNRRLPRSGNSEV